MDWTLEELQKEFEKVDHKDCDGVLFLEAEAEIDYGCCELCGDSPELSVRIICNPCGLAVAI